MDTSDLGTLKSRWTEPQTTTGQAAISCDSASPFPPMADGFSDLRGLVVTTILKYAKVSSVDLSGATFEKFGQFAMCDVEKVRFRSALMETNLGRSFRECDFSSAKLLRAILRGAFVDCDFSMANLSSAKGTEVRFVRCVFVKTNFNKAHLLHCTFEDCRFEECKFHNGSLAYSKFIRSPIPNEDLGNTILDKVIVM